MYLSNKNRSCWGVEKQLLSIKNWALPVHRLCVALLLNFIEGNDNISLMKHLAQK